MESGDRWIAFDYDNGRISHAHDSNEHDVRYTYDARGRLARVTGSDGTVRRYTYTDLDELETIEEPTASITNRWEGGRCVRQVNWYEDGDLHIFEFISGRGKEGPPHARQRVKRPLARVRLERARRVDQRNDRSDRLRARLRMHDRDDVSGRDVDDDFLQRPRGAAAGRRTTSVRPGEEERSQTRISPDERCS